MDDRAEQEATRPAEAREQRGQSGEAKQPAMSIDSTCIIAWHGPGMNSKSSSRRNPFDLLQDLARRTVPAARDAGRSQADRTVEKLEKAVHGMRRNYDKVLQVRWAMALCVCLVGRSWVTSCDPHANMES